MRVLVTGAAGFVGSHLAVALHERGHEVHGVDNFSPYYSRATKERNLALSQSLADWHFRETDVASISSAELAGYDSVIHLAAQPGVRTSWSDFQLYLEHNLNQTNTLALNLKEAGVHRVVFASSSSVYGNTTTYPTSEDCPLSPRSPYGVTKLAGERLWSAHCQGWDLGVVALRFFTVYGPGQRPDMATQRLVRAAIEGQPFTLYGTGEQRRDFTYVSDVAEACVRACEAPPSAGLNVVNVGGTGDVSMNQLISLVAETVGKPIDVRYEETQNGDVDRTGADARRARDLFGWRTMTTIEQGVAAQVRFELDPSALTWRGR